MVLAALPVGPGPRLTECSILLQGKGVWRVRVLGIAAGGDGPEALTDITNNLLPYDGESGI